MVIKENMSDEELNAFILYIEEKEMINAPANLKEQILKNNKNEITSLQISGETKRKTKKTSAKIQLFIYSLKISAAAAAAIFLLAFIDADSAPVISIPARNIQEKTVVTYLNEISNEWSNKLNQFSDKLY